MADFVVLPNGLKVLDADPVGSGGDVLNDNFTLLDARTGGYTHVQTVAASVWMISHNLGKPVAITITDSAGNAVVGDVRIVNLNTVEVRFTALFIGRAYVV